MQMTERYHSRTSLSKLTDEEKQALRMLDKNFGSLAPAATHVVLKLEEHLLLQDIRDWDAQRRQNPARFRLTEGELNRLLALCQHQTQSVQDSAASLYSKLNLGGQGGRRRGRRK